MANNLVPVADAATQTTYTREYIRRLAHQGTIDSVKMGPALFVNVAQLIAHRATTGGKAGGRARAAGGGK